MARTAPRPLEGIRVVVTRAARQAGPTGEAFEEAGARVELLPLLEVVPPDDPAPLASALARLPDFSWVCFTSPNAVEEVLRRRPGGAPDPAGGRAVGWPAGVRVAAVGSSTGERLRGRGIEPDL